MIAWLQLCSFWIWTLKRRVRPETNRRYQSFITRIFRITLCTSQVESSAINSEKPISVHFFLRVYKRSFNKYDLALQRCYQERAIRMVVAPLSVDLRISTYGHAFLMTFENTLSWFQNTIYLIYLLKYKNYRLYFKFLYWWNIFQQNTWFFNFFE